MQELLNFMARYDDESKCRQFLFQLRWPNGFVCTYCGNDEYSFIHTRNLYQCMMCRHQVSLTSGTMFHNTKLPISYWLFVFHWFTVGENCSARRLSALLQVHYRTALRMMNVVRQSMKGWSGGSTIMFGDNRWELADDEYDGIVAKSDGLEEITEAEITDSIVDHISSENRCAACGLIVGAGSDVDVKEAVSLEESSETAIGQTKPDDTAAPEWLECRTDDTAAPEWLECRTDDTAAPEWLECTTEDAVVTEWSECTTEDAVVTEWSEYRTEDAVVTEWSDRILEGAVSSFGISDIETGAERFDGALEGMASVAGDLLKEKALNEKALNEKALKTKAECEEGVWRPRLLEAYRSKVVAEALRLAQTRARKRISKSYRNVRNWQLYYVEHFYRMAALGSTKGGRTASLLDIASRCHYRAG